MLIGNPTNNHAFIVGEVVGVKDSEEDDNYYMIRVKHHIYDAVRRISQEIITAVFIRNTEGDILSGRAAILFADRARKMKIRIGSRVGVYCVFGGNWKVAKGYSVAYDGITSFRGLNRNDEPTKFSIVMGVIKSISERIDRYGNPFTVAHVYLGKWIVKDLHGNIVRDSNGSPTYQYKYVDIKARNTLANRFQKALRPTSDGLEKSAAFLCEEKPYTYIANTDGTERQMYSGLHFEIMGLVDKSQH